MILCLTSPTRLRLRASIGGDTGRWDRGGTAETEGGGGGGPRLMEGGGVVGFTWLYNRDVVGGRGRTSDSDSESDDDDVVDGE